MFRVSIRRSVWLGIVVPVLASLGCDAALQSILNSDVDLPIKNEAGLTALATQFADKAKRGDFAGTYALCSSHLKGRQTEEQFVAELKNQWALHTKAGQPQKTEIIPYMPYKEEFEEWEGMPKDIKYASLQGQVTVTFGTELEDEEIMDGFDIDLFVVEEGGQPKIAYLEFYNYSE